MPKMKTHKSTSKRFRISKGGKGKLMRTQAGQEPLPPQEATAAQDSCLVDMHEVDNKGPSAASAVWLPIWIKIVIKII